MTVMVLANDYYSFDKEYDEYISLPGSEEPRNSICLLMKQHGKTLPEARLFLKQKMLGLEQEYRSNRKEYEATHQNMPTDLRKFLDAAEYAGSGAFYWCSVCPRYNAFVPFKTPPVIEQDANFSDIDSNQNKPPTILSTELNGSSTPNQMIPNGYAAQPLDADHFTEVSCKILSDKVSYGDKPS